MSPFTPPTPQTRMERLAGLDHGSMTSPSIMVLDRRTPNIIWSFL